MVIEPGGEQKARFGTVLARCQETLGATKGALYLSLAGEPCSLVSWFGFRAAPRPPVGGNDLLVERLITGNTALGVDVAGMVLSRHERIDGKGYPRGMVGADHSRHPGSPNLRHLRGDDLAAPVSARHSGIRGGDTDPAGGRMTFDVELSRRFNEMLARVSAFGIE